MKSNDRNLKVSRLTKKFFFLGAGLLLLVCCAFFLGKGTVKEKQPTFGGTNDFPDSNWFIVNNFQGFQTKIDPVKIPAGASPNGQNTTINNGDKISVREFGYTILGTATTTEDAVLSLHTFRKRSGENLLLRNRGTFVEYYEEGNDSWENLLSTSTDGQAYSFADYNINTDLRSQTYFGNAYDSFARWNGAHTLLTQTALVGTTTIHGTLATDFFTTGTLRICGVNYVYSSRTETAFSLSSPVTTECATDRAIAQTPEEYPSLPRGNQYLVANNRIFIAGITSTPQAVYFSEYGNALSYLTTLVSDSTAASPGIFNLGEGGGAVTGMTLDEGAIYFFKKSIIYRAVLSDSLYVLEALKPFDGKSQTTGAINHKLVFTGGNGVFFVTPDNQIMSLARIEGVDYPQLVPISDVIKPTVDNISFDMGAGITYKDRAFFSIQSDLDGSRNDAVLVFNDRTKQWDLPIIGWSVNDWTIYDSGDGEELYFADGNTANVFRLITDQKLDNDFAFTASFRTKLFDFAELGIPSSHMKELNSVFVEGYITENTNLNISLLLDENGSTESYSTSISATDDTELLFDSSAFNIFGLHAFGYLPFGTSPFVTEKKKFRVYLNSGFQPLDFYTAQLEFSSDEENNYWEVTSFGFKVREATQPEKTTLFKAFN